MAKRDVLSPLRKLIAALPETSETLSHGAPTFWGGRRTFACYHDGAYDEGRRSVWIKAPEGAQAILIEADPQRFFRPKYVGPAGWVGMRLEGTVDWNEVAALLVEGWRTVAPKRALAQLAAAADPPAARAADRSAPPRAGASKPKRSGARGATPDAAAPARTKAAKKTVARSAPAPTKGRIARRPGRA